MPNEIVEPKVELVAFTQFVVPESLKGEYQADMGEKYRDKYEYDGGFPNEGAQHLAEFAGRACYQSWSKPNPATATNKGYLAHIIDVGHLSTFEHGSFTFYITGVSRSFTHELVRHRPGMAYSQLSQRYVPSEDAGIVVPPELRGSADAEKTLRLLMDQAVSAYEELVENMQAGLQAQGVTGTEARKRARQAARCVMPNMTETRIVVTGNLRAWRHFLDMRAAAPADHEIREVAMQVFHHLKEHAPNAVQDYRQITLPDGTDALERN